MAIGILGNGEVMTRWRSMTVPALRVECKRLGLPTYQHRGRRLVEADLIRQLTAGAPQRPLRRPVAPAPSNIVLPPPVVGQATDPMAQMRAKAERDLLIDFETACKHATALGISRSELLDQDATTMHGILQGCSRPADERHWRTKEVIRGMVAVSG